MTDNKTQRDKRVIGDWWADFEPPPEMLSAEGQKLLEALNFSIYSMGDAVDSFVDPVAYLDPEVA